MQKVIHSPDTYALFKAKKLKRQSEASRPSDYWDAYVQDIVKEVETNGLSGFGKTYALTRGFGDTWKYPNYSGLKFLFRPLLEARIRRLQKNRFKRAFASLQENLASQSQVEHFTKVFSDIPLLTQDFGIQLTANTTFGPIPGAYLNALIYLFELEKNGIIFGEHTNVLEIGGGYGALIDSLNLLYSNLSHGHSDCIDLFPANYICYSYLRARYGTLVGARFDESQNIKRIEVLGTIDESQLFSGRRYNLVFNSNSFQEMSIEQVEHYVTFAAECMTEDALLCCFIYRSKHPTNSGDNALEILNKNFSIRSCIEIDYPTTSGRLFVYEKRKD